MLLMITSGSCLLWNLVQLLVRDLPFSLIADSLPHVGDKTLRYQLLRLWNDFTTISQQDQNIPRGNKKGIYGPSYNVLGCPYDPPHSYPYSWNAIQILSNWPVDSLDLPKSIYQALCVFDYRTDRDKALRYRSQELPFVVQGHPGVLQTVKRWSNPNYLPTLLGSTPHRTEISNSSLYLYWLHPRLAQQRSSRPKEFYVPPAGWKPPTEMRRMSYQQYMDAKVSNKSFHYFQIAACGDVSKCEDGSVEWLFDELPYFQPRTDSLFVVEQTKQKGVHCRFGKPGLSIGTCSKMMSRDVTNKMMAHQCVQLASHFDGSRNAIAILKGARRYLLAHPRECPRLGLYPMGHPSARHSRLDWRTNPPRNALLSEIILQAGDVLYLPTHWFHMIVTLEDTIQCNTRSGIDSRHLRTLQGCGFENEF
jgi:hypothetical protein